MVALLLLLSFASGTPSNINYVRLQHPSGEALTQVLSVDFNGRVYASARFADGRIFHYYDGTRITDWFDGRARNQFQITGGSLEEQAQQDHSGNWRNKCKW